MWLAPLDAAPLAAGGDRAADVGRAGRQRVPSLAVALLAVARFAPPRVLGAALPAPSVTCLATSLPLTRGDARRPGSRRTRPHPHEPAARTLLPPRDGGRPPPCSRRISTCVPVSTTACPASLHVASKRSRSAARGWEAGPQPPSQATSPGSARRSDRTPFVD